MPVPSQQSWKASGPAPFTETFTTPGPGIWVSTVTGMITVQCWGAGASGVDYGGGGGEFAQSNVAVTLGQSIDYYIDQGGGDIGFTEWDIGNTETPSANDGGGQTGGSGGKGDILFSGGDGGTFGLFTGGGGGGAGGTTEVGGVGQDGGSHAPPSLGGAGGSVGGGNGGNGGNDGLAGQAPGGGGGGGAGGDPLGGLGASGQITIIYPAI